MARFLASSLPLSSALLLGGDGVFPVALRAAPGVEVMLAMCGNMAIVAGLVLSSSAIGGVLGREGA